VSWVYAGTGGPQSSGSGQLVENPANGTQVGQYISTQAGDYTLCIFLMTVDTNNAGNIAFGFSGANGATPTVIEAGSFVRVTDITAQVS
jgi:hypothetical protein